jgi:hypothetical protein
MNRPITLEEANEKLRTALSRGDQEEVAKWDFVIRGENDYRVVLKHRNREMRNQSLEAARKESLRTRP